MFTGLIEEIGTITGLKKSDNSLYITVKCSKVLDGIKIGDSIAVNGACQTVIEFGNEYFKVFASSETLAVTAFSSYKTGQKVNLERTLRLCDRLDGHMVSGHIDGIANVKSISKTGETTVFAFDAPAMLSGQLVKKGSVAIDGISLTIADIEGESFSIAVIPHTLENTTLQYLKAGSTVNIETDIIAKYIEKYLLSNNNITSKSTSVSMDLLERNGFL